MKTKILLGIGICLLIMIAGCVQPTTKPTEAVPSGTSSLPNPASVFCEQQGYKLEIRTASDGSQSGVCVFLDGSECDEWAYFRGECLAPVVATPTAISEANNQGWKTYTNQTLGYSFLYPADAQIITNDDPLKGLYISGGSMGEENWGIAHSSDRPDYRPPEGVDLLQWLVDHYLLGENRQPDIQIAGQTAIHFRHNASPQSYAFDQYYFAHAGQLYQLSIGHASEVEDWELDNQFLQSFQFNEPVLTSSTPHVIPTTLPIDPSAYQDWTTYTNPDYGFSLRLPDVWVVDEVGSGDPLLVGHALNIHSVVDSQPNNIRLTYREIGDDTPLWPTGVGQGEFIQQGTLDIVGQPALRVLLVCPSGEVTAIWYHQAEGQPNLSRGDLVFGIIFSTPGHCEPGNNLTGEAQRIGEAIISSLSTP